MWFFFSRGKKIIELNYWTFHKNCGFLKYFVSTYLEKGCLKEVKSHIFEPVSPTQAEGTVAHVTSCSLTDGFMRYVTYHSWRRQQVASAYFGTCKVFSDHRNSLIYNPFWVSACNTDQIKTSSKAHTSERELCTVHILCLEGEKNVYRRLLSCNIQFQSCC